MASLFNTKISDTYPGLIKTLDNAAISASLKELTDGSGNQSGLYINTAGDFKATGILEFGSLKDTGENITITKFVDEADGIANNDNDTTIPTSAAVVDYVASRITLEDLDFSGDSGTGSVDLDSQVFAITGTTNQIITSASSQTLNLSLPSTIHRNLQGNVTGIGILSDGSTAVTQSQGDNSTKIATTAYVDAGLSDQDTLAEVLAVGNTTGGTDISVSTGDDIIFADSSKALFGNGDLQIQHNGSNSIIDNLTGTLIINQNVDDGDIQFNCDNGSGGVTEYFRLDGSLGYVVASKQMAFIDNAMVTFGGGADLQIYHNGGNSFIDEVGTGSLYLRADDSIEFKSYTADESLARFISNDRIELYFNGSKKFETTNTGITVTGNITFGDSHFLGDDGNSNVLLQSSSGEAVIIDGNTNVRLQDGGNTKLTTTSTGIEITGQASVTNGIEITGGNANFADNSKARFGASADLEIYHSGSHSIIQDNGTGDLLVRGNNLRLQNSDGLQTFLHAYNNQGVELYYNANKKFETTGTGVSVTGNIAVSSNATITGGDVKIIRTTNADSVLTLNPNSGALGTQYQWNVVGGSSASSYAFQIREASTPYLTINNSAGGNAGNATFAQSVTIAGDLTVNGTTTTVNTEHFNVEDPLISMGKDNAANSVDIGFYGRYNDGTNRYLGLFSDASDSNTFNLFKGLETEPTTTVDTSATGYDTANLRVQNLTGASAGNDRIKIQGSNGTLQWGSSANFGQLSWDTGYALVRGMASKGLKLQINSSTTVLTLDTAGLASFAGDVSLLDNKKIKLGTSDDLELYHNGTDSVIENNVGDLYITNKQDDGDIIFRSDDGTGAFTEYFRIDGGDGINYFFKDIKFLDNGKIKLGDGSDLQIYHDGSNSYIDDAGSGRLNIRSNDLRIEKYTGETIAKFIADGAVELNYNDVKKFETTSSGVNTTGIMEITSSGVGVIGAVGNTANDVNIYSTTAGHNGLRMHVNGILPTDHTGTIIDNDADLGDPSYRFKDLYLSGNITSGNVTINGDGKLLKFTPTSYDDVELGIDSNGFVIYNTTDARYDLKISGSGNATFGGDVDAAKLIVDGASNSNVSQLALTRTDFSWGIFNETDLRFYVQSGNTTTPNTKVLQLSTNGSILHEGPTGGGTNTFQTWQYGTDSNYSLNLKQNVGSGIVKHIFDVVNGGLSYSNMLVLDRGNVGIGKDSPENKLHILTSTTDTSSQLMVQNGSTGDAAIKFNISGQSYVIGIDNSDSDKFKISGSSALGTTDRLVIDTSGNSTFTGNINSNSHIRSAQGSGGVSLSGYASPDLGFLGYNYVNDNGTESVSQSIRNSWRLKFGNGSDRSMSFDYRAPSAAADAFTKRVGITSDGELTIGSQTGATALLQIEDTAKTRKMTLQSNGNNQGFARNMTVVNHYPVVSSGSQLIIPFISQGNLNSTTIIKLMGHSAKFNNSNPQGFTATIQVGHLQQLYSTGLLDSTGNISGISTSGMNLIVSFTNAYTSSTADGVFVTLEYMTNNISYSIDVSNIAMN